MNKLVIKQRRPGFFDVYLNDSLLEGVRALHLILEAGCVPLVNIDYHIGEGVISDTINSCDITFEDSEGISNKLNSNTEEVQVDVQNKDNGDGQ